MIVVVKDKSQGQVRKPNDIGQDEIRKKLHFLAKYDLASIEIKKNTGKRRVFLRCLKIPAGAEIMKKSKLAIYF